jgi:hypothetical protein
MQHFQEIIVFSFVYEKMKKMLLSFFSENIVKYCMLFFILFVISVCIYSLFSFEAKIFEYSKKSIALSQAINNQSYKQSSETENIYGIRREFAIAIKTIQELAYNQINNKNVEFAQIIVQERPTNSIRMTNFLLHIKDIQDLYLKGEINFNNINYGNLLTRDKSQVKWRNDKKMRFFALFENPKNKLISIYTNDKFSELEKENILQHQELKNNINKFKSQIKTIKADTLPIEKGAYYVFKVKEYAIFYQYYVFHIKAKQDDQLVPITDDIVEVNFYKFSSFDKANNLNISFLRNYL